MRAWAFLIASATIGCGASIDTTATDGGTTDGGAGDGGVLDGGTDGGDDGGWSPVCPAALPRVGGACPTEGVACEYGTSVYTACNSIVTCASGSWQRATFPGPQCPSGPNPPVCAPSFASVPRGADCAPTGTECAYAEGACRCDYGGFGPPPPQDGGLQATWRCDDPQQGCPTIRPRLGSACAGSMSCMYVECAFAESCSGGVWTPQPIACAGGGGTR